MAIGSWIQYVRVATTGSSITLSGLLTIDGVTLSSGDRVLVKDQSSPANNGIYAVASGAWSRTTDATTGTIGPEMVVRVGGEGATNAHTEWSLVLSTNTITVGTTSIGFSRQILRATLPRVQQVLDHTRESATAHSL